MLVQFQGVTVTLQEPFCGSMCQWSHGEKGAVAGIAEGMVPLEFSSRNIKLGEDLQIKGKTLLSAAFVQPQ